MKYSRQVVWESTHHCIFVALHIADMPLDVVSMDCGKIVPPHSNSVMVGDLTKGRRIPMKFSCPLMCGVSNGFFGLFSRSFLVSKKYDPSPFIAREWRRI